MAEQKNEQNKPGEVSGRGEKGPLPKPAPELTPEEIGSKINALFGILNRNITKEDRGKIVIEIIKAGILFKPPMPMLAPPFGGGPDNDNGGPPGTE